MSDKRKAPWTRICLSVGGILVILAVWRWATQHLYTLPEASLAGYVSITNNCFYTVSAIVIFCVSGKMLWDYKNQAASVVSVASEVIHEKTERAVKASHFDDPTIP